jgi:hypothetical protein
MAMADGISYYVRHLLAVIQFLHNFQPVLLTLLPGCLHNCASSFLRTCTVGYTVLPIFLSFSRSLHQFQHSSP